MTAKLDPVNTGLREELYNVVVMVPAWNEEETIAATIASIQQQTVAADRIVVVVNNTTDNTAAVAKVAGAEVLIMEHNKHKKAGALNYGLDFLSDDLDDHSMLLVMDADTTLDPRFIEVTCAEMRANPRAGGVSSVFEGRRSRTLLGAMQRMEYFRYKREVKHNGDQSFVLSGTASLIRWVALQQIVASRQQGDLLPQGDSYYDTVSLTEDNELTFALLTLGWECPAPGVTSTTDVMETVGDLVKQRRRWYLGALGNIWNYGTKMPWSLRVIYWGQQAGLTFSVILCLTIITLTGINTAAGDIGFGWLSLVLLGLHLFERSITAWRMGWRYRLIALSFVPELLYAMTLLGIFVLAVFDHVRGRTGSWHTT